MYVCVYIKRKKSKKRDSGLNNLSDHGSNIFFRSTPFPHSHYLLLCSLLCSLGFWYISSKKYNESEINLVWHFIPAYGINVSSCLLSLIFLAILSLHQHPSFLLCSVSRHLEITLCILPFFFYLFFFNSGYSSQTISTSFKHI